MVPRSSVCTVKRTEHSIHADQSKVFSARRRIIKTVTLPPLGPSRLVFLALLVAGCWHGSNTDPPSQGAATDGSLTVWVDTEGVHVVNRTDVTMALAVYDRDVLLTRSSDRDACMIAPVAQCPSVPAHGIRVIPYAGVVEGRRKSQAISVRYWPSGVPSAYPQNAKTISVARVMSLR